MKLVLIIFFFILFTYNGNAQNVKITIWKDSVIGAIYNKTTALVAYGKKDKKGYYKIFVSDSLGNNEKPLVFLDLPTDRHYWPEEWHPSGKFIFCYVEKAQYVKEKKHKRAPVDATPGYGAYTDIWLISIDGKQQWQLTNVNNTYDCGIIHSAISHDGNYFAWSERIKAPKFTDMNLAAGAYVMRVAEFVMDSIPCFKNIRTYQPGNVLACNELESISPDNKLLTFYSSFESKHIFKTPIYTLNIETGEIKKLTEHSFAQAPTITTDGSKIVYMTGYECDIFPFQLQGADWWIMNLDGSEKRRLTFMNKKNHHHSVNKFKLCGSISFMSNNTFLGGVMTKSLGLTGYTVKVTFE